MTNKSSKSTPELKCSREMVQEWQDDITRAKATFGPGSDEHCKAVAWAEAQGPALVVDYLTLTERLAAAEAYQARVSDWVLACFGPEIAADKAERSHRFLEEALELVQSVGCTKDEAQQLVEYVYSRPDGEPIQEVGGVMVTLAALCQSHGLDMRQAGQTELNRVWTKVEKIRAKQAAKPQFSPLPAALVPQVQP